MSPRFLSKCAAFLLTATGVCLISAGLPSPVLSAPRTDANQLFVVDCLLPGQVRRLGTGVTYLTPRRPVKTSASDCEIRGGEYTSYDRANYATSLKIWLPQAKQGDPKAQTYVGEIYEKGLGLPPDYLTAAGWYRKAAEQGYAPAQINLGSLYEKGLGVERNPLEALNWFRRASGLVDDDLVYVSTIETALAARDQEITSLRTESRQHRAQAAALREQLVHAERALNDRKRELRNTESKLSGIRRQLDQQRADATRAPSSPAAQKERNQRAAEIEAQRKKLVLMEAALIERDEQIARLRRNAAQHQKNLKAQLEKSEQQLVDLNVALADAQRRASQAQAQLRAKTTDPDLSSRLKAAEEENLRLENQRLAQEQHVRTLRSELEDTQRDLELSKTQLAQAGAAESEVARQVSRSEAETRRLKAELVAAQDRAETIHADLVEARASLSAALNLAKSQNSDLVEQIEAAHAEKNALERELFVQREETESVQQDVVRVQQELQTKKAEYAERETQLLAQHDALNKERERLQELRDALTAQLEEAKQGNAADRSALQRKLEEQETQYKTLLAEQEQRLRDQERARAALAEELEKHRPSTDIREPQVGAIAGGAPVIELIDPPLAVMRGDSTPFATLRSDIESREIVGRVTAPGGLIAFSMNDRGEQVDPSGMFKVKVPLSVNETPVRLVAVDKQGRRSSFDFVLQRDTARALAASSKATKRSVASKALPIPGLGNYHALIIGNNKYAKLQELSAARRDAEDIAQVLTTNYGFKTRVLLDADRYEIMSALNDMREKLTEDDNLLVYFAGHGLVEQTPSGGPRGYWLPINAEPDSNANWISNTAITEIIETIRAKHVLIVADSCYSGTLSSAPVARVLPDMSIDKKVKHISILAKARARIVIASGGLKPIVDNTGGDHSVFAQAFLEALEENDDVVDVWGLFRSIRDRMQRATQQMGIDQEPQYAAMQHAGHAGGVFFFAPS